MAQVTFASWMAATHPGIPASGRDAVLRLAEEGATVPFIARYRKEQTGALDEVAIRAVIDGKETWDGIRKRQGFIVSEIERQGKLTDELRDRIQGTYDLRALEDLYLPYKHVSVRVLEVKLDKQQIALSMRSGANADVSHGPRPANPDRPSGVPGQGPRPPSAPPSQRPLNNPFAGLDKLRGK